MKIVSTKDSSHKHVNMCIYGDAGIGKTTLCSTATKPLIISAEGGLLSLSDYDLPVVEIKTWKDCDDVYVWLNSSKENANYDTICIDSLSEIAEVLLIEEKNKVRDARQAYGAMSDKMSTLIRLFRDLPGFNIYFTCKMKKVVEDQTGRISYTPSVPGNVLFQSLPYFFDEVFVMRYGKLSDGTIYRYLQTEGDLQYIAKDRSGKLNKIEQPDITKVINKIKGV